MNILRKLLIIPISISCLSCINNKKNDTISEYSWIINSIDIASNQLIYQHSLLNGEKKLPRSTYTSYNIDFLCEQLELDSVNVKKNVLPPADKNIIGKIRCCDIYD